MKNLFCIIKLFAVGAVLLTACTKTNWLDSDPTPELRPSGWHQIFNVSVADVTGYDLPFDSRATREYSVTVQSNVEWSIVEETPWTNVRMTNDGFIISASRNKTINSRDGKITIAPKVKESDKAEEKSDKDPSVTLKLAQSAAKAHIRALDPRFYQIGRSASRDGRFMIGTHNGSYWILDTEKAHTSTSEDLLIPEGPFAFPGSGDPQRVSNNGHLSPWGITADGTISTGYAVNRLPEGSVLEVQWNGTVTKNGKTVVLDREPKTPCGSTIYRGPIARNISDNGEYISAFVSINGGSYVEGGWRLNKTTGKYEFSWYEDKDVITWEPDEANSGIFYPSLSIQVYQLDPHGKFSSGIIGTQASRGDIYYRDLATGKMTILDGYFGWMAGPINSEGMAIFCNREGSKTEYGHCIIVDCNTGKIRSFKDFVVNELGVSESDFPADRFTLNAVSDDMRTFCWSKPADNAGKFNNELVTMEEK